MAVLFSAVTVTSDSDQAEFLVAGVPKSYADLEGWTAFESFMNEVDTEQDIKVHVAACLYGEGESLLRHPKKLHTLQCGRQKPMTSSTTTAPMPDTAISRSRGHRKNYSEWR